MLFFKQSKPDKEDLHDPREHEMREIVVIYLPDRLEADVTDVEESLEPALFAHPDTAKAHIKLTTGFRSTRIYTDFPLIP